MEKLLMFINSRINLVKMALLPKVIYMVNENLKHSSKSQNKGFKISVAT